MGARLLHLLFQHRNLLVYILNLRIFLSVLQKQLRSMLLQFRQLCFGGGRRFVVCCLGLCLKCSGRQRRTISGLGCLAVILRLEQLLIETGKAIDNCVLTGIQR